MIIIENNWIGAVLAFAAGAAIAVLNYFFSRYVLKKHPTRYLAAQSLRQVFQVGYLVLILALGNRTPWDRTWLLVAGCLGLTLPMVYLTPRLLRLNEDLNGKEDPNDG